MSEIRTVSCKDIEDTIRLSRDFWDKVSGLTSDEEWAAMRQELYLQHLHLLRKRRQRLTAEQPSVTAKIFPPERITDRCIRLMTRSDSGAGSLWRRTL